MEWWRSDAKRLGQKILQSIHKTENDPNSTAAALESARQLKEQIGDDPEGFVVSAMDELDAESRRKQNEWWGRWGFLVSTGYFALGVAVGVARPWHWLPIEARATISTVVKGSAMVLAVVIGLTVIWEAIRRFTARKG